MGAGATPPGWYPDVERPQGERYWNGVAWTEDRRPSVSTSYSTTPPAYGAPPGYQPYGAVAPRTSNAVAGWALGLSIVGLVLSCCGGVVLSIVGLVLGRLQMNAMDRGERDPSHRSTAKAAFVIGIIGIAAFALLVAFWLIGAATGA